MRRRLRLAQRFHATQLQGSIIAGRQIIGMKDGVLIAWSPIAQQQVTYNAIYQNQSFTHQPAPGLPIDAVITDMNNQFTSQNIDAFADSISGIQGPLLDTYQIRVWARSASPIDPLTLLLIFGIVVTVIISLAVVGTLMMGSNIALELITRFLGQEPRWYNEEDPSTPYKTWSEFLTAQNARFWYVCSKDGKGFGDKKIYPTITDVPQEEVDASTAHCQQAADLSAPIGPQLTNMILLVVVLLGGLFIISWGARGVFGKGGGGTVLIEKGIAAIPGVPG